MKLWKKFEPRLPWTGENAGLQQAVQKLGLTCEDGVTYLRLGFFLFYTLYSCFVHCELEIHSGQNLVKYRVHSRVGFNLFANHCYLFVCLAKICVGICSFAVAELSFSLCALKFLFDASSTLAFTCIVLLLQSAVRASSPGCLSQQDAGRSHWPGRVPEGPYVQQKRPKHEQCLCGPERSWKLVSLRKALGRSVGALCPCSC